MATGGQKLRVFREKLGLTMRDIETASERIASKRNNNEEYLIPISRLSDFETKGVIPSIYRLYSLAVIYRRDLRELLLWYDVNLDPGFDPRKTLNFGRMVEQWGTVPLAYLDQFAKVDFTYGYIGSPLTGLRLQKIKARRPQKMPFNSLAETLAYIKVVEGLRAKAAIATVGFAGLTVSELQGLDWSDRYDGQWHVERKVVEGRTGDTKTEARQEGVPIIPYLQRITDEILEEPGMSRQRVGFRPMVEQP